MSRTVYNSVLPNNLSIHETNLSVIPEIEKAGQIEHSKPGQAGQLKGRSESCLASNGIQHMEPETSRYSNEN